MRGWLLGLLLAGAGAAAAPPAYDALPQAKALAVVPGDPAAATGLVHSQPHELAASVLALEQCQRQAPAGRQCEVVRLNDQHITTGAQILARVPDERHPLFLWRYRRGATVVYLAGSIHILKPSLYPLPAQLEAAFRSADYLVLEVDVTALADDDIQRRTLDYARLPHGQTLGDVLPEPLLRRLDRHLANFGLSSAMLQQVKPALVMNQVVVSRLLTLGYLPDSGLENHFIAQRRHQRVLELETIDQQLALLFGQPMPTQVQLLAETLDVEDEIEPILADMLVAWLSGDDAAFLELFKAQSGDSPEARAFVRQLLDERNDDMAQAVLGYLEGGPDGEPATYFVLVGAAHLVGERGIVALLANEGIEGERIHSDEQIAAEGR